MPTELRARAERTMTWALTVAGLRPTDVESVELVGGGTRMPEVKQLVRKVFQREPSTALNQDEAVARGCALQCAMLSLIFKMRDLAGVDAKPYPIELYYEPGKGEDSRADVYPQEAAVPHPDLQLGIFMVNKVVSAAKGEASKIKVKVRLNLRGISVVSASAVDRKPDGRQSMAEGELFKKEEWPSPKEKQAKATELPLEVRVPQLSAFEMDQLVEREVQMIHIDHIEKERLICQAMVFALRKKIGARTYSSTTYVTAPDNSAKGVIHSIPSYDSPADIERSLERNTPRVLQARRLGEMASVLIVFEGKSVPYYINYRNTTYRCLLYRRKIEVCENCYKVGHRKDICPTPDDKRCSKYGTLAPEPEGSHECTLRCAICGNKLQTKKLHHPLQDLASEGKAALRTGALPLNQHTQVKEPLAVAVRQDVVRVRVAAVAVRAKADRGDSNSAGGEENQRPSRGSTTIK
ncbi:hypothetical protein HPB47_018084, partial [Ixodes persulcatus]